MQWFRFYSEALDDPKVQRLPGDLFKAWVNLLCLANEQEERGTLPELSDIAFRLRVDELKGEDAVKGLVRAGLLEYDEDGVLRVHAWLKRQPPSDIDSTAAERKRRERDRKRDNGDVTDMSRVTSRVTSRTSHGPVTGDVTRLEKSRGDTEKRERESISPPAGEVGGADAPRHTPARPTPLVRPAPKPKDEPPKERPRDLLFEAVCDVCLIDWHQLTDRERGKVNVATGQIRKAGGTPEDIPTHAANYRAAYTTPLTPMALAGNWAATANAPPANLNGHRQRTTVSDHNDRAFEEAFSDEPAELSTVIEATWRRN